MSHAVHYRDASGEIHLEDVASLEAAVELVERLRNEDGATDVRVFREIPLEVRTYYKVVALDADGAVTRPEPPPGAMPLSRPPVSVNVDAPAAEEPNEGRRLFNRA